MEFFVGELFNGVSYGALLFLLAGGLSLIFGMMRIVNMIHGSYYLLGGGTSPSPPSGGAARGCSPSSSAPPPSPSSGSWSGTPSSSGPSAALWADEDVKARHLGIGGG